MLKKKIIKPVFISKNLDFLLKEYQIDIKNLSVATGVPAPSISRLKKEGANPTISTLEPLLDFFKVDMKSFLYEDLSDPLYQNKKKIGNIIPIPVFNIENIGNVKATIIKFIASSGISNTNCFGISLNSDAFFPVFQKNSILIIDPDSDPKEGDYILCKLDKDDIPIFRKILFDGKTAYFQPINPAFGKGSCHSEYEILGVVIKSIGSYR